MNITFSWEHDADRCFPVCKSNQVNQDGVSLLDCILMDSGGLGITETVLWLHEGTKKIQSVMAGELKIADWSRETWGAEFRKDTAKIYSLHDEEYCQVLSLGGFLKVLQEWAEFLQSQPNDRANGTHTVSIDS